MKYRLCISLSLLGPNTYSCHWCGAQGFGRLPAPLGSLSPFVLLRLLLPVIGIPSNHSALIADWTSWITNTTIAFVARDQWVQRLLRVTSLFFSPWVGSHETHFRRPFKRPEKTKHSVLLVVVTLEHILELTLPSGFAQLSLPNEPLFSLIPALLSGQCRLSQCGQ